MHFRHSFLHVWHVHLGSTVTVYFACCGLGVPHPASQAGHSQASQNPLAFTFFLLGSGPLHLAHWFLHASHCHSGSTVTLYVDLRGLGVPHPASQAGHSHASQNPLLFVFVPIGSGVLHLTHSCIVLLHSLHLDTPDITIGISLALASLATLWGIYFERGSYRLLSFQRLKQEL